MLTWIPNSSLKCENVTKWVTDRVKILECASAAYSFGHIRQATNKLTHFLSDWALLSDTSLLNSPTLQPDADVICTLYTFHITVHLLEKFPMLGRVVEKTADKTVFLL